MVQEDVKRRSTQKNLTGRSQGKPCIQEIYFATQTGKNCMHKKITPKIKTNHLVTRMIGSNEIAIQESRVMIVHTKIFYFSLLFLMRRN